LSSIVSTAASQRQSPWVGFRGRRQSRRVPRHGVLGTLLERRGPERIRLRHRNDHLRRQRDHGGLLIPPAGRARTHHSRALGARVGLGVRDSTMPKPPEPSVVVANQQLTDRYRRLPLARGTTTAHRLAADPRR